MQIVIASPDSYRTVLTVLSDIMYIQPKESMTQNALSQIIAITTVTGNEFKVIHSQHGHSIAHSIQIQEVPT